jgi:acyl-CoA dehydrogenase
MREPFDLRSFCIIREMLSYSSSLADLAFAMQGLGTYAISLAATEHVRDFWLARAVTGKAIAAFALTEPDAGSDVAALKTSARRDDDSYIIDGRKRFISNAGVADFYTVFARTDEAPGTRGISAFVVLASDPGFSIAERIDVMAPHPLATRTRSRRAATTTT